MQPTVRHDFNELIAPILDMAESMLEVGEGFTPFGARLACGGQLALIDVARTLEEPSNPLIVDALYATFRLEARQKTIRACAVCWDALVPRQSGGLMDAIAIGLEHRDGDPTILVCSYAREPGGDIHFEEPVTSTGRRHVFGSVLLS
jgi:hypothetical protein